MAMTLRDLRYFLALERERHFGRAARTCFVSQPTLSAGIRRLELELGVRLFERTNRSVMISAAGSALLDDARRLVREAEKLQDRAQDLRNPLGGTLRFGVIPTIAPYLLPHLMPLMSTQLPRLSLRVHERVTDELLGDLRQGALDLVLLSDPYDAVGLRTAKLFDEAFVLAVPDGHDLSVNPHVSSSDLQGMELLLLAEGHCMRDQVIEICQAADGEARDTFGFSSIETLRSMVAAGAGCTLLPALAADPARSRPGESIRPLRDPTPHRQISLAWRPSFPRASIIERIADLARDSVRDSRLIFTSDRT